jgi:hypothetical protein
MTLQALLEILSENGCSKVYVKCLAPNDNSKNQVYLGGSFDVLNILPFKEIRVDKEGDRKVETFKSKLDFYWVGNEGNLIHAPYAQLILYPDYPEVRFSGFLLRSKGAPSELMRSRTANRLLFLGISQNGQILGYVTSPDSEIANEFNSINGVSITGIFSELTIEDGNVQLNSRDKLLSELKRIHQLDWIDSKRFDKDKNILPCASSNCGGYTLEAELGIKPNGFAEPDYLGWEVKQFGVKSFHKFQSEVITLMTPEPTHGYYTEVGIEEFIFKYGYPDKKGRESRINFGGIYKYNKVHETTNLKLIIHGYNITSGLIENPNGFIGLIDHKDQIAASWSFASLLLHWNTKHNNACYVPSQNRKDAELYPFSKQQYRYGNNVMLGTGTDFYFVLRQIALGNLYYDPGIKLEMAIKGERKQAIKRRSQFRMKSGLLINLYKETEVIDLMQ